MGGESVFQFLNLTSSSRQVALGGEVLTLMGDVNQPIWNPAVINPELDRQLSVNYTSFLANINVGSASYAHVLRRRFGTIHGSVQYLNYGIFIQFVTNGSLLNEKLINNLCEKKNISLIGVSIDGATKETFEKIRVRSNFELIISNTRRLISKIKEKDKSRRYTNVEAQ